MRPKNTNDLVVASVGQLSLLQCCWEALKQLSMVPGTECSLHKERLTFILQDISTEDLLRRKPGPGP